MSAAAGADLIGVLDVGKTHTRFIVVERGSGTVVSRAQRMSDALVTPMGRQLDVAGIEQWLLATLASHPRRTQIRALVPIAHGAAAVLVDAAGQVLTAPDYEDPQFDAVAAAYRGERDGFDQTLSPFLPLGLNLGRQLYFLQTQYPALFNRARWLLLYPQYWAWRLSGVAASERTSLGSHSDLWSVTNAGMSRLCVRRGWDRLLPPLRRAGDVLGNVSAQFAQRTGIDPLCQVLCGIHDSNASFLCHLATQPSGAAFSVISSGTWTVVFARGAPLETLREQDDMLANIDAEGSPVATARFMGGREYAVIAGGEGRDRAATAEDIDAVLRSGALALPSFADAGGPFAGRRGQLIGAEALSAPQRSAVAALYVALMSDYLLDRLQASGPIIVDGPLANNACYLCALSALRAGSVVQPSSNVEAAVQAALLLCKHSPPAAASPAPPMIVLSDPARAALQSHRLRWRATVAG